MAPPTLQFIQLKQRQRHSSSERGINISFLFHIENCTERGSEHRNLKKTDILFKIMNGFMNETRNLSTSV